VAAAIRIIRHNGSNTKRMFHISRFVLLIGTILQISQFNLLALGNCPKLKPWEMGYSFRTTG